MPRIAGVDMPAEKRAVISLTYIFGIGKTRAQNILNEVGIDESIKMKSLSEDQISRINAIIDKHYAIEGSLKRQISQNIQRLKDIRSYRGARHRRGLPARGQRTRSNARTRKGPRRTVAVKKIAKEKT